LATQWQISTPDFCVNLKKQGRSAENPRKNALRTESAATIEFIFWGTCFDKTKEDMKESSMTETI